MNYYLIIYDLNIDKKYEDLEKAITALGEGKKILESTWILRTQLTLDKLHSHLVSPKGKGIDENDDLLIIEVKEPVNGTYIYEAPKFQAKGDCLRTPKFLGDFSKKPTNPFPSGVGSLFYT